MTTRTKKKNLWENTERKSTAEVLYPNQLNNAPSELNLVLKQAEDEHKKKVAYYQQQLGRQLTGSEVLYPDNIEKNSRGETITPYKDWAAQQQWESSLSGVAQPIRQQKLYAQAAGNATDATQQRQLNELGYYRPDAAEFDHINRGPGAPLGLRNRNPANVRPDGSSQWDGLAGVDQDNDMNIYENDHFGIRSSARSINTQFQRGQFNTVEGLMNTYAPADDNNNTQAYINHIRQRMNLEPNQQIDLNDPEVMTDLLTVMIQHENGQNPYTREQIRNAVRDALHRQ